MKRSPRRAAALCLAMAALCCSCQQYVMTPNRGGASVGMRTYADSVVHIGQVDPAYRPYFQSQNGANYSLSDQRKAYIAATETARTPVRESDYRPGVARKKSPAKGKAALAKKKSPAKNRAVAVAPKKKPTTRRR